ncbi:MAG TPA: ABC transporter permease [Bacteroidota bacterium]|nr:ABC transporter permease [Bacteroidota bacterium]
MPGWASSFGAGLPAEPYMLRRIYTIIKKEFRQVGRDKRTLGILIVVPAFMIVMFGYALNFDVKHTSIALYDEEKSDESRAFMREFLHSEYFDFKHVLRDKGEIDGLLGNEQCRIVVVIPKDFSHHLKSGEVSPIQLIVDGANSNAATTAIGYVMAITEEYSTKIVLETLRHSGRGDMSMPIDYRPRVWYNPELRSAKFLVPGLIAFILMVTAVISTSLSVVRESEKNTIEQIIVSRARPIEFIIGKTVPFMAISFVATIIILVVSYILFDVAIKGSLLLLFSITLIFLAGCLGLGLLISTVAETQQVAFLLAVILTMLPTFLLSGFVFPIRNMPVVIQVITYFIPARYFLVVLRSIILKGVGIQAFYSDVVFLLVFAVVVLVVSAVRMKRRSW